MKAVLQVAALVSLLTLIGGSVVGTLLIGAYFFAVLIVTYLLVEAIFKLSFKKIIFWLVIWISKIYAKMNSKKF